MVSSPEPGPPGVRALLDRYPVGAPPRREAGAAVLILLREGVREPEVLLIERSERPDDPASGQVALPGGRVHESDASLRETALREFEEEVGVGARDLSGEPRFVGYRDAALFGLRVAVFAAELAPEGRGPVVHSPREVAHVFWLPCSALARTQRIPRETPRGRVEVDATLLDGHVLWGFTRRVLREFFGPPASG